MKQMVFSILDIKAGIYSSPFLSPTKGSAMRAFQDSASDPNTPYNRHPDDYVMYYLGTFDDNLAHFELLQAPEVLGSARQFKIEA